MEFPIERIRNFCIIAHVDHGKSTLADRLLEICNGETNQYGLSTPSLDTLLVEKQRGITVKAQTASFIYRSSGENDVPYLLNLIDTPGHIDFSYEVSRAIAACQGALLLVDASQGVQAQTVANFWLAFSQGLCVIPIANKTDLPTANLASIGDQIEANFEIPRNSIIPLSAKTGENVITYAPLRALLFDSKYDSYKGVVCHIFVVDGSLKKGEQIQFSSNGKKFEVLELGFITPQLVSGKKLRIKDPREICFIGDTIFHPHSAKLITPLPGFQKAKSKVFAGLYPQEPSEYNMLKDSIEKLLLNDSSISICCDASDALGRGWRLGFLGSLHMDVFQQRLLQEFGAEVIFTSPTVLYKINYKGSRGTQYISSTSEFPGIEESPDILSIEEPMVRLTLIVQQEAIGPILSLLLGRRGVHQQMSMVDSNRTLIGFRLPLAEIIVDFFDTVQSISSGFVTFDYEEDGYEESDLVKISCLVNRKVVPDLSLICHRSKIQGIGKTLISTLKELIPRQQFEVALQAAVGGHVISRDNVKAYRKDVTAKLYGGDPTRRMKLLEHQKEGKKKLKMIGDVEVPQEAFLAINQHKKKS
ncbi:Translation factor guf1 mitochondrial [Mitosporidium daphniae]